ncbi:hypothetical protein FOB40_01725 [Aeromonas veronii]|nr:hypothetical protein FOB40_01725 [Aeromonas veronii]
MSGRSILCVGNAGDVSRVRMQGQGMAGERRPVYLAWIHWRGGDNVVTGGSNETPRLSLCRRGVLDEMSG